MRVNDSEEVDGALALLKLEAGVKQMGPSKFQISVFIYAHLSIMNGREHYVTFHLPYLQSIVQKKWMVPLAV